MIVVVGYLLVGWGTAGSGLASAPAPALDPAFGDGGIAGLDPSSGFRTVVYSAPLPDGSLVVNVAATNVNGIPVEPFALAKFDPSGRLDTDFGDPATPGFVASVEATAMAADREGRVLLAGSGSIWRYNASGALDATFVRTFPFVSGESPPPSTPGRVRVRGEVRRIHVGADGSIVVAGSGQPFSRYSTVTRLLADGDYDPSFGEVDDPGLMTLPFTPIVGPVELPGGRIGVAPHGPTVAVGVMPATPTRAVMYVLAEDGKLDTTVGDGGVVPLGPAGVAVFDLVRSGGRLLVNGHQDGAIDGVVVASDLWGVPDRSWGRDGRVDFADLGQHSATLVQWPDRVAVGLEFVTPWDAPRSLVRLTDDGALDGAFGNDPDNPGWLLIGLSAPAGYGHWLRFIGLSGGALVGVGREGLPPTGGIWSRAEIVRTVRFDEAPVPVPLRPYASPASTTTTSDAPTTTFDPTGSTVATTTPSLRIDGGAEVHAGATRIRP